MVHIKTDAKYRLLNLETGTYLTRSTHDNYSIVGEKFNERTGQVWVFRPGGNGKYFIKLADSQQYVAVPTEEVDAGKQLTTSPAPFVWKVVDVPNVGVGARFIPAAAEDLYIDLYGALPEDGTKIQLWTPGGNAQIWVLEEVWAHH